MMLYGYTQTEDMHMNVNDRTVNAIQGKTWSYQQQERESLTYTVNWSAVLGADTIETSEWTVQGQAMATGAFTDSHAAVTVNASQGRYKLANVITTANGETHERVIKLQVLPADVEIAGDYE